MLAVMSAQEFASFFAFPFVWYALLVGVLIALCSSLLGVNLVLKRLSFIGDGLSHVAFGAMALAAVMGLATEIPLIKNSAGETILALNDTVVVLPITILAAIVLLKTGGRRSKQGGDASLALISVSALALGYLVYNFSGSSNLTGDVCSTLFGSTAILSLTALDLWLCIGMSVIVIAFFLIFYNKIFAITFDETFAKASGVRTEVYSILLAVIIAFVIVLAMNLVGSLLISALVIFPALSAMRVFKSFRLVVVCSAIVSVLCAVLGMLLSIWLSTPVGSTIVAADLITFLGFTLFGYLRKNRKSAAY